jgi:Mor family transcriptional regulator
MRERYAPKRTNENYYTLQKERNKKILAMYLDGDSAQFLADKFNLTKTRIYQILKMQGYSIV